MCGQMHVWYHINLQERERSALTHSLGIVEWAKYQFRAQFPSLAKVLKDIIEFTVIFFAVY